MAGESSLSYVPIRHSSIGITAACHVLLSAGHSIFRYTICRLATNAVIGGEITQWLRNTSSLSNLCCVAILEDINGGIFTRQVVHRVIWLVCHLPYNVEEVGQLKVITSHCRVRLEDDKFLTPVSKQSALLNAVLMLTNVVHTFNSI